MKLNELEIKIALGSEEEFQRVFQSCFGLFGPFTAHSKQLDEYYDTEDHQLKKQDLTVRIRNLNNKRMIALKGPRMQLTSGITNRIELEFLSAEEENVADQLKTQGLAIFEAYEKERWTFIYKDSEILLDKLPFIGSFIEIEGPSEGAIKEIVALLHLSSTPIRKNYSELMKDKFIALKLPLTPIYATFEKEKELLTK